MKFRKKERIRKLDSYIGIKRNGTKIPSKILNDYFRIFKDVLFSKPDRRDAEMIVHYLKIYSLLNEALNLLTKENYKNAFNRIEIVRNLTKGIVPIREQGYSRNINDIVSEIYRDKNRIVRRLKKHGDIDPVHARTKLQLAQNICILRILRGY